MSKNIKREESRVSHDARRQRNGHLGGVVWLTGLSGSGKSTLARGLEKRLFDAGCQVAVLDGDNLRHGLNNDLGFSPQDRTENIRRTGEVAALLASYGMIVVTAFISPYRADRAGARAAVVRIGASFHEVYVEADVAVCEGRDPKGLYAKARAGEIPEFTGISAPYEAPEEPELRLDTAHEESEASLGRLEAYVTRAFRGP